MQMQLFLLNNVNDMPAESLQTIEAAEANKLIQDGRAVEAPTPQLTEIQGQIDKAVADFRNKVNKIKTSDDPVYKVPGGQEYHINLCKAELDATVAELQAKYEGIAQGIKEAARADLANGIEYVSPDERAKASDIVAETVSALKFGNDVGSLDMLVGNLPYYSDSRKLALLKELPKLAEVAKGHMHEQTIERKLKSLYRELNTVREARLIPVKIANAISTRGDDAYRRLKMTHQAYKEQR